MRKKLVKHGNSYALVIERPILELLNIKPDAWLEVSTTGKRIIIQDEGAKDETANPAIDAFLDDMDKRYGEVLKHLA
jgi:antitoxin component of MazEF toxin-antitoxin module